MEADSNKCVSMCVFISSFMVLHDSSQRYINIIKLTVPDRTSGKCLYPGKRRVGLGNSVCVEGGARVGNPSRALPTLRPQEDSSTVDIKKQWRKHVLKVAPTHTRCNTAESSGQQSENIVLLYRLFIVTFKITSYTFVLEQC
jgi:hypothetical protein